MRTGVTCCERNCVSIFKVYRNSSCSETCKVCLSTCHTYKIAPGQKVITFDGLIDSGADECTFPGWIAKALGHNVYKGKQKIFSGIGGSVLAYLHKTHLRLNGIEFLTDVYYSHKWDDMPFGLLGQAGFFSKFEVYFNYKEKEILLRDRS